MRNLKMIIEYVGSDFYGWQKQPEQLGLRTVQHELEKAVRQITSQDQLQIIGAGRTDTGVHAKGQVANVTIEKNIECNRLHYALNCVLPKDINIVSLSETSENFHARFDALSRAYRYFISQRPSVFTRSYSLVENQALDQKAMQECATMILGKHDFSAFSKISPDQQNKTCSVLKAQWQRYGQNQLMLEIQANRFLHSMVRLLVGAMLDVGKGKKSISDFQEVLTGKNVKSASPAAPPQGLFLWHVQYKDQD